MIKEGTMGALGHLIAQPLLRSSERCYIVEILLRRRPEIKAVRAVPEIGSLAVHYDPGRLPEVRLLAIVDGPVVRLRWSATRCACGRAEARSMPATRCWSTSRTASPT